MTTSKPGASQLIKLEKGLYEASHASMGERAKQLAFAADLLTEARACELSRLC